MRRLDWEKIQRVSWFYCFIYFFFHFFLIAIKVSHFNLNNDIIMSNNQVLQTYHAAVAAKSLQLCPTLCDPIDGSPPGSPVPGILQARTLEWVAISFSTNLSYWWLISNGSLKSFFSRIDSWMIIMLMLSPLWKGGKFYTWIYLQP